jgi:demethylmenaquinone methyltransferase/2-methoxy-6-polyprenyl-1,4-benzoquinol methylase/phosphoethanolamine N-methyltransferase
MHHSHRHNSHAHATVAPATRGRLIRWAKYYDASVSLLMLGRRAQLRQTTVALAGIRSGDTVLEVGCGTGDVALAARGLAGPAGTVAGIDPAPEMIAVARAKAARQGAAVNFQIGVIEALAFPDASFDVVLSSLMMHHLPEDLKRQGLAEIARVLKPGGRLLIVDVKRPTGYLERIVPAIMLHAGLTTGIQGLPPFLRAAGFSDIELGETGFAALGYVRGRTARFLA